MPSKKSNRNTGFMFFEKTAEIFRDVAFLPDLDLLGQDRREE